ncbi:MAG: S1 RNA-binding domain-containing protein, partial [Patescibacteria group bacterium]
MSEEKKSKTDEFKELLEENPIKVPKVGDIVTGAVVSASKAEVRLDIDGIMTGVVRGRELYNEAEEYSTLKSGDTTEATVIEEENENGEMELSFRHAGEEKAWQILRDGLAERTNIKVKILAANKGGLLASFRQINGFLPVSQLSPENYPRVEGGDKSKILDKLRSFVGKELEVKLITLDEKENKIIFSEKDAWLERRKDIIGQYQIGSVIEGTITAVTDFGIFIKFGENLEGLIHISELAWQRIDNPSSLYKVGDIIKAEIISMSGSKIFLSAKKLMKNPWDEVEGRYKVEQTVKGKILKVNPFGLFVALDEDIHGLAHINQLNLAPTQKINEVYKEG